MQLTANGFQRKSYDDYIAELEQQAQELFGANVNLSDKGPIGKWIRLQAYGRAEENELAEAIYLSAGVDNAEGIGLDNVVKNVSMARLQATKATGNVNLTVDAGTTIDAGLNVGTIGGVEFVTTESATDTDNDGLIVAAIEAVIAGSAGIVPANTITVINTPVVGLQSVTNPSATTGGRDTETDKELKDRHAEIGANSLSPTINGIRATILNDVPDVKSCIVINNNTNVVDADGRPPHCFEAVVYGGSASDIAKAILKAGAGGIQPYGSQTVTIQDDSGNNQTIGFSYATAVQIYVHVSLVTNTLFPSDGNNEVIDEVVKYIGGVAASGVTYLGLGMSEAVINQQAAFSIIKNVAGVDDITITFSTDNVTFNGGNVAIGKTQVAQTSFDKVVIA